MQGIVCFLALGICVGSCTVLREFPTTPLSSTEILYDPAITYQSLKETIAARCVPCHGPQSKEGSYDMSSYAGIRGEGRDHVPNAIAGDTTSLVIRVLRMDTPIQAHRPKSNDEATDGFFSLLRRWIVDYRMAYFRSPNHTSDIHLPGTSGFHGALLKKEQWQWSACTRCHGEDLNGGASGISCLSCHDTRTAQGCASCHRTETSGSFRASSTQSERSSLLHQRHLQAGIAQAGLCQTCHPVPTGLRDGVHLDGQVQIQFSQAANYRGKQPQWDAATKTCTETACHGAGLEGAQIPVWGPPQPTTSSCQNCHGMPPKTLQRGGIHPVDTRCSTCHPSAHQENGQIKEPALHLNGQVEVAFQGDCRTCHGDAESAAPPRDLTGNTATTAMGVGAHRAHLGLSGNKTHLTVPCSACHLVPSETFSKGHIDTLGPAEVIFQGIAILGGLVPRWDREKGTCSQVYCHGATLEGGVHTTPVWNQVGSGQSGCGSCHGMPPRRLRNGDSHTASTACSSCHTHMRPDGSFSKPELHLNGRVDL